MSSTRWRSPEAWAEEVDYGVYPPDLFRAAMEQVRERCAREARQPERTPCGDPLPGSPEARIRLIDLDTGEVTP